jgi:hypothetical protein
LLSVLNLNVGAQIIPSSSSIIFLVRKVRMGTFKPLQLI